MQQQVSKSTIILSSVFDQGHNYILSNYIGVVYNISNNFKFEHELVGIDFCACVQ